MKANFVSASKKSTVRPSLRPVPIFIASLIILALIAGLIVILRVAGQSQKTKDLQALIEKVGTHLTIKRDEQPMIATVKNEQLVREKNPAFYRDAVNGDRVLLWSDQAVLFRESEDRVVAVLPIRSPSSTQEFVNATTTEPTVEQALKESPVLEVRNGSGITGAGKAAVERLKALGFTVLPAADAKVKTDYEKTVIMKGNEKPLAVTAIILEKIIGSPVVSSTKEELPIKGDYLIILGTDIKK